MLAADVTDIAVPEGRLVAGFDVGRTRDRSELALFEDRGGRMVCRLLRRYDQVPFSEQESRAATPARAPPGSPALDRQERHRHEPRREPRPRLPAGRAEAFTNDSKERWATDLKILFQRKDIVLPRDRELIGQVHSIKRRVLASGKVSFDAERTTRGGQADRFWAIALACQKERGPAPKTGTEIGVRVVGEAGPLRAIRGRGRAPGRRGPRRNVWPRCLDVATLSVAQNGARSGVESIVAESDGKCRFLPSRTFVTEVFARVRQRIVSVFASEDLMPSASSFIDDLQSRGRYHFSTEEAAKALGSSLSATQAALRRLKAKGEIADPHRGFHVVVPPEYRRLGCLPAEHFIPQLMQHLGEPYYVALLSAAAYHGAAHQKPQRFQVMVPRRRRPIACGEVHVQFISRNDMARTPIVARNTPRGVIRIASAAATAHELVGYPEHAGGLNNVATVLAELAEALDAEALIAEARRVPLAWVQRLGYLLTLVEASELAAALEPVVRARNPFPVALAPSATAAGCPGDARWKVSINVQVEPDL